MKPSRRHADPALQMEFERIYAALAGISRQIEAVMAAVDVIVSETEPASPVSGTRWFKPSTSTLKEYINGAWIQLYPALWG